jgi:hypothetical protein
MKNRAPVEAAARFKPSPLRLRRGEGWVRGQPPSSNRRIRNATRYPLTPTLSPNTFVLGERQSNGKGFL